MKLNKVVFSCEIIDQTSFDMQELRKMDLIFERDKERPVLIMETSNVKIEDRSLPINNNEILKELGKIDFEFKDEFSSYSEYGGKKWSLIINDKEYEGVLEDPYYVVELKKVLKYNSIELYALKKMANYYKK